MKVDNGLVFLDATKLLELVQCRKLSARELLERT